MCKYSIRTDLALEARESVREPKGEVSGVRVEEQFHKDKNVKTTRVMIESKNAAKKLGKPQGIYITLEADELAEPDDEYHREISEELADALRSVLPKQSEVSVLVVGLGNRDVTADALGPNVVDNLCITRHILLEYGKAAYNNRRVNMISSIVPGVMAKTGMESLEIVKGVVEETHPDLVIVIDALAARSTKRLTRTIQVTDTGIHPGSGVGNHRNALTKESLGVPVIAIGVPTVVDAATIVNDAIEDHDINLYTKGMSELNNMYVTGKDIDETIKRVSFTISEALNMVLSVT